VKRVGGGKKLIKLLIFRFTIVYVTQIISKHNTHIGERNARETLKMIVVCWKYIVNLKFLNNNNVVVSNISMFCALMHFHSLTYFAVVLEVSRFFSRYKLTSFFH
jgi:uncharacterized membrane protein YgcG